MSDDDDEAQDWNDHAEYLMEHQPDAGRVVSTAAEVHRKQVVDLRGLSEGRNDYQSPRVFNNLFWRSKDGMLGMNDARSIFTRLFVRYVPWNSDAQNEQLADFWFNHRGEHPEENFSVFSDFPAQVNLYVE